MKIHIFISGFRNGTMDLDKKLPNVIKTYPDGKIQKTKYSDLTCIHGINLTKNIKIIKLLNQKVDLTVNIDLYAFEKFAHSYFDISFDLDKSLVESLMQANEWRKSIFVDSTILINDEPRNFAVLITEYCVPYYDLDNALAVEQSLEDDLSALNDNVEIILQKTAFRPYYSSGMMSGMSLGPEDNYMIIEDFNNELDTSSNSWENIMPDTGIIYVNNIDLVFVCKNKDYCDDLYKHNLGCQGRSGLWKYARNTASMFLNAINKKGQDIKKNIVDDHRNPYYWKELKKTIEIMDLNFLELHTDIINMTKIDSNDLYLKTTIKYKDECEDYLMKVIKNLHANLNEVKYAISNLSTPSHTHDEAILQQETEKVNDRILMLSFIAMAVSALGMMRTLNDVDFTYKIIAGSGIFALPVIYYLIRNVQKKISLRKNEQNEWKRRLAASIKGLEQIKKERDSIKDNEDLPDDLKKEFSKFLDQFVVGQEQKVEKLKKKIK